jgi:hypothetical protein
MTTLMSEFLQFTTHVCIYLINSKLKTNMNTSQKAYKKYMPVISRYSTNSVSCV